MIHHHPELAQGRWAKMPFLEQMANIGSEVERTLMWRGKEHPEYSRRAFERSLELMDLSLENAGTFTRRKELARVREVWADYCAGTNQYESTEASWRRYFAPFFLAARKDR